MDLTGKQKRALRAQAHHLHPVVQIGSQGVTGAVLDKTAAELDHHELIKVKVGQEAPVGAKVLAQELADDAGAALVQVIGRVVVLYKRRKKNPVVELPAAD